MTTWEAAHSRFLQFVDSMGGGAQTEGETVPGERVTIQMKNQDRLPARARQHQPAPQQLGVIPPMPERRPVGGLGDLDFGGPMPERRGAGPDDAGAQLENGWQAAANTLPDRAGDALEAGYANAVDRSGLGAYRGKRPDVMQEIGATSKFRW